jgi:hypothetical protein
LRTDLANCHAADAPLCDCADTYRARPQGDRIDDNFAEVHESENGTFRPFSNVRRPVVVGGKPDIETEPKIKRIAG